jgi:hypothetical protein
MCCHAEQGEASTGRPENSTLLEAGAPNPKIVQNIEFFTEFWHF